LGAAKLTLNKLVRANQADLPVQQMRRVLGVSTSGFHARRARVPSRRALDNAGLTKD
jgi:hypothetical protein